MKTIPVEAHDDNVIRVPLPTTRHHVMRVLYKVLLAAIAVGAIGALARSNDPAVVYSVIVFVLPLPTLWWVEYKIRKVQWTSTNQPYRGLLFALELTIPIFPLPGLVGVPLLVQAYGYVPSVNILALIDITFMFTAGLGGVLTNRVWALHQLGFEN